MNCPKCGGSLSDDSTFCPYCGCEKLDEAAKEAALEKAEAEKAEEVEAEAEEALGAEAVDETEETEAVDEIKAEAEAEIVEHDGDKAVEGANGAKAALIAVLCVLAVLAAVAAAFVVGMRYGKTPVNSDVESTTDSTTGGDVTTEAPDSNLFPDEYTLVNPDGVDYLSLNIDEYIKVGEYKGLEVPVADIPAITDRDVDEYINIQLEQSPINKSVTDRPAQNGDKIVIDFVGMLDGVAFDGGTGEDYSLTLGSGTFIEDLEAGIVGMKVGETKNVDVTFPEDYHSEELKGKAAVFEVTLDSITEQIVPAFDDTFVRENSEYNNTAEYIESVKAILEEERQYQLDLSKQNELFLLLIENCELIKFPEGIIDDTMYMQLSQLKQAATAYGMTYEDVLSMQGYTAEGYESELRVQIEQSITQELAFAAIAVKEGFTAADEEINEEVLAIATSYGYATAEEFCAAQGITEEYLNMFAETNLVYNRVYEFLMDNTNFTIE